ncbi:2-hydroxychromene-2-carboxylate isomerase [Aestuariicella hydrocarbonica]|uniref:2-hydroxychromene-2-carboxylate isomerase n=1 Tax=Pseudomaricurvus hydrocarbonicus TaxID=1470433 RepID=A0A9E5MNW1_9GAMM|nr:2-hydroxychromene-2-carboxylate isomerase [Aestuariicella hydrocarbonica]NHO67716.1 2-hydroxychromene-2-carboxylate isomerase [Aestuariicella hydrocarbonica]
MTTTLDFYFDFGSPTAFLAYKRLQQLQQQYDLQVNAIPMLLGGVFKATGNTSPVTIPAKGKYMMEQDLPRFAKRYQVEMRFNPFFPINTLQLMRGAVAAQQLGEQERFMDTIYNSLWQQEKNLGDPKVLAEHLQQAGLNPLPLLELSQTAAIKQQLIDNTEHAVKRGAFGAPTLFLGDEMFFGQDRLDFVEEILQQA